MAQTTDGYQSMNGKQLGVSESGTDLAPGVTMASILDVDMVNYCGEYEVPEELPEWQWIASNASFQHCWNGTALGVWEFVVRTNIDCSDMPETLARIFETAKSRNCAYIIFHQ